MVSEIKPTRHKVNGKVKKEEKDGDFSDGLSSVQFSSFAQSYLTLFDSMDCSTPGFPVLHPFLELAQTHVH